VDSNPLFFKYIGIDYSGAGTPNKSLKGLRVFMAGREADPVEVLPPSSPRKYWTRRRIAEWLRDQLIDSTPTLVGIDHGFSFPLAYFEKYQLGCDWDTFLDDFQRHWPTDGDGVYVDFVREGVYGAGGSGLLNPASRVCHARRRRATQHLRDGPHVLFNLNGEKTTPDEIRALIRTT
jgi:hypothetical protein